MGTWRAILCTSPASKGPTRKAKSRDEYHSSNYEIQLPPSKRSSKAGFQMTDITSVTVYITDLNDVHEAGDVYKKLIPDPKPARATVQVAGLIGGAKIEISAIAVKQ